MSVSLLVTSTQTIRRSKRAWSCAPASVAQCQARLYDSKPDGRAEVPGIWHDSPQPSFGYTALTRVPHSVRSSSSNASHLLQ